MKEILFAHIAPTKCTQAAIDNSSMNMVLAHIAEKDNEYCTMFKNSDKHTLLDNGAFENGYPMSPLDMCGIGARVGADVLVLPDFPFSSWYRGWDSVERALALYKAAGFKTMFIPQSLHNDSVGYYLSLEKALEHPDIDYIGLSILACPNAGLLRRDILKRYTKWTSAKKRFHMLGMLGSVDEIKEIKPYEDLVHGWDTSAAVWYGVNGRYVENSYEKLKLRVDFNSQLDWQPLVNKNINYIKGLL